ncbi:histone deacetylase family protein, partial [Xanthomonas oryzae pv. oryzae]
GHHATAQVSMGFCLFNNIAVAAAHARDRHGLERITIVDFDVHHGNGTQAIFERDPAVQYLSTHQSGLYPHSGSVYERGVGNIHNLLLPPGSDGLRFRNVWEDEMLPLVDAFRPQLLLISAGFDAHLRDPLADLMLDDDDFAWLTGALRALADRHARGRVVSMLEGGYDLQALRESSVAHVAALR